MKRPLCLALYLATVKLTAAVTDNDDATVALMRSYPNPRHQSEVSGALDWSTTTTTNAINGDEQPLMVCDPEFDLQRDQTRYLIQSFQAQTLVETIVSNGPYETSTMMVHPTMGVAVLPWDNTMDMGQDVLQRSAVEIQKQWGLGDIDNSNNNGIFERENTGFLILLVKPVTSRFYIQQSAMHATPQVAVSVGASLRRALGDHTIHQAVTQMQNVLNKCSRRRGDGSSCFDVALAQGIPLLTKALLVTSSSSSSSFDGPNSQGSALQTTPWYIIVLKSLLGFPVIGILVVCCLCRCMSGLAASPSHDMHNGTTSKTLSSKEPSVQRRYWTSYVRLLPGRVQVGRFGAESCPVCLESFQQVSVQKRLRFVQDRVASSGHPSLLQAAHSTIYYLVCGQERSPLQTLPCGHCMCQSCWHGWLDARTDSEDGAATCPLCRLEIGQNASPIMPWSVPTVYPLQMTPSSSQSQERLQPTIQSLRTSTPLRSLSQGTRLPRYMTPMTAPAIWPASVHRERWQPEMWYGRRDEERLPLIV